MMTMRSTMSKSMAMPKVKKVKMRSMKMSMSKMPKMPNMKSIMKGMGSKKKRVGW